MDHGLRACIDQERVVFTLDVAAGDVEQIFAKWLLDRKELQTEIFMADDHIHQVSAKLTFAIVEDG